MKRRWKLILGIVALIVVILIVVGVVRGKRGNLTEVTVAEVETADLVSKVSANGRIEAQRKVDLSADVMGQIVNLGVEEGDVVERGDFLLQIDRTRLAADTAGAEASIRALFSDREGARANLAEAQANFERARSNFEQNIIARAELDRARAALDSAAAAVRGIENRIDQARANLSSAQNTLSKTTITAPMSGIVTSRPVDEGEVAVIGTMNNPGTVLMTISDMSVVEAVMEVDETDVPSVRVGQPATVTIDAYPNRTFQGAVTSVGSSPITQSLTGASTEAINFEVKIQLENPPEGVRPGFSASAEIVTGRRDKATAIPIQALVVREKPAEGESSDRPVEEEGVFLFDDGAQTVKFAPVTTGLTGDVLIEIESGLEPGQKIVTGPFSALREISDGDKVKLEKPKEKSDKKS